MAMLFAAASISDGMGTVTFVGAVDEEGNANPPTRSCRCPPPRCPRWAQPRHRHSRRRLGSRRWRAARSGTGPPSRSTGDSAQAAGPQPRADQPTPAAAVSHRSRTPAGASRGRWTRSRGSALAARHRTRCRGETRCPGW